MRVIIIVWGAIILSGCWNPADADEAIEPQAELIAQQTLILDSSTDFLEHLLYQRGINHRNITLDTVKQTISAFEIAQKNARQSGLNSAFINIEIPDGHSEGDSARQYAEDIIALVSWMETTVSSEKFRIARSVSDISLAFSSEILALPLGISSSAPIAGNLKYIDYFHRLGVRYLSLTSNQFNLILDSVNDTGRQRGGLSPYGKQVVNRMNKLGVMVDVSQISGTAFYEIIATSEVPVISINTLLREFMPGMEGTIDDEMLKGLATKGGVAMLSYGPRLRSNPSNINPEIKRPIRDLDNFLNQIDHAVSVAGINHVGIGSGYGGLSNGHFSDYQGVAVYQLIVSGLLKRNFSEADIKKILSGNFIRVWSEVERYAYLSQMKNVSVIRND